MGTGGVSYTDAADFGIGRVRNRSVGHNPRGDALSTHAVFLINGHFSFVSSIPTSQHAEDCSTTPKEIMSNDVVGLSYLS